MSARLRQSETEREVMWSNKSRGIEEADGIFRGDIIVERLREGQGLGAIDPGTMIHA